jgi:hypothetical protein
MRKKNMYALGEGDKDKLLNIHQILGLIYADIFSNLPSKIARPTDLCGL